ncbi:MAG: endo-1,4-beta-xylanase [Prolixibacteraceae bacterium]|nr:endo-1,4-beta-xylanase [Prolixibacteraceae bacterium]
MGKIISLCLLLMLTLPGCNASEVEPETDIVPDEKEQTIRELVADVFPDGNVFIGAACHQSLIGTKSYEILNREFSYVTPANDFKQSYIHPEPGKYQYEKSDEWVQSCKNNKQVIRMHAPISPQCSKWAKEDNRTAEELQTMLEEYITALCAKYNGTSNIRWMDVVNETIDKTTGGWFGPKEGTDKWENPWPKIGFDETNPLRSPLYIKQAFTLANRYAPNIKQIINQHGALEEATWNKMKVLVAYLRENNLRVDGLGWQAHIELGWEKIPGNIERLGEIVRWCISNNLEFHITEFNVWLKEGNENKLTEQAATFKAITKTVLDNRGAGMVGINFWHIRAKDTQNKNWDGCLYNNDYQPKPAYFEIKELLKSYK